ncbi:MAG: TIM-barrel domain-containing protein, partial [Dysgonomonas sp.]
YKAFFKNIMRPHENIGVDFWWLDWQQWLIAPEMSNLGNTFWLNHVFYNDMRVNRPERRPMIFHRWGGLGSHRYPLGFSGDTWATFPTLAFQVYYNSTASNVAYGYWGHDLGGHNQSGANNPELYLRWLQFGVFSPITRTHATNSSNIERRIWKFPNFSQMRDALKLRYALIPYIYSSSRQAYDTGLSICRPLYYDSPQENEAYKQETSYMFGDDILVSPIVAAADSKIGTASKQYWLPKGRWFEAQTGTILEGNQTVVRSFAQNEIPFYYKEGAVIPMYTDIKHLKVRPDTLIVQFIPGESGSFNYYEDEGDNEKYKDGKYTTTRISQETSSTQGKYTISPREGAFDGMPTTRHYEFRLLSKLPAKEVVVDGKVYPYSSQPTAEHWSYDSKQLAVVINTPSLNCNTKIEAVVKYDDNQTTAHDLIAGKMGQMDRLIQCNDSLKQKVGNKIPALFTKMVGTRARIAEKPQNTLAELQDFQQNLEASFDLLLAVANVPVSEITDWKNFILHSNNVSQPNLGESNKNTVPGYNRDGSKLWITGSAIPGNIAVLTEDPTQVAGYFRYHGKLQAGEFKIINTSAIQTGTKFYVPTVEETNVVGTGSMQATSSASTAGWKVTIPDNYYKIKVDAIANTLSAEIFNSREDVFIVGGATEAGWDSGKSIRMKKDLNNPNLFVFSGILKESTSGDDRNMFKLLGQSNWDPISFHPKTQKEALLGSKYIFQNLSGDYKWAIDQAKQGSYVIKVDLLEETITAEHSNLVALYVNGTEWKDMSSAYILDCSNSDAPLDIEIVPLSGATVNTGTSVEFNATKPGLNTFDFTITSPNGIERMTYQLKVVKPFAFHDLVTQMWNNTLTVNNNPENNGGYKFVSFEWYENGQVIGENKQYYSAGKLSTDLLNKDAVYMVKLKDDKGFEYQTCPAKLTFETLNQISVYPNPVKVGETVTIETGTYTTKSTNGAKLNVYSLNGNIVYTKNVTGNSTSFEITDPGIYLIRLTSNDDIYTARLIVK